MTDDVVVKIGMLKDSVRCLIFGVLSLLPVIGLPFGLIALWTAGRVRERERYLWNAAKPYRIWGTIFAVFGIILGLASYGSYMLYALYHIGTASGFFN
jgi:hypothetical protein